MEVLWNMIAMHAGHLALCALHGLHTKWAAGAEPKIHVGSGYIYMLWAFSGLRIAVQEVTTGSLGVRLSPTCQQRGLGAAVNVRAGYCGADWPG